MATREVTYSWKGVRRKIFNRMAELQTERLCEYAPEALSKAYEQRSFQNDTMNLADSYVWAVYYKGVLKKSGYLWDSVTATTPSKYHGEDVNGRQLADEFVEKYTPQSDATWEMVIAATTPYAPVLEKGNTGNPKQRFMVISTVYDDIVEDFGLERITKIGLG